MNWQTTVIIIASIVIILAYAIPALMKTKPKGLKIPSSTGKRVDYRNTGWGHNIMSFHKQPDDTFTCLTIGPRINLGDELLIPMESGKTGICRVIESEWKRDPHDMYGVRFGIVGYLEDENG